MDQLELQKRLPIVRQALRLAQGNGRERGRLLGLCLPKKVRTRGDGYSTAAFVLFHRALDVFYPCTKNVFSTDHRNYVSRVRTA